MYIQHLDFDRLNKSMIDHENFTNSQEQYKACVSVSSLSNKYNVKPGNGNVCTPGRTYVSDEGMCSIRNPGGVV